MKRIRVAYIAPVEPWCRENGSSLITADLLEALADVNRVDVLPIFGRRPPPGYPKRVPSSGSPGTLLDIEGLPRWASIARATLVGGTPLRMRFPNRRVARAVDAVLRQNAFEPDVIHVEHLPLVDIGLHLARPRAVPLVYRAHNVESQLWRRRLGDSGRVANAFVRRMEREEAAASREAQMTLCISQRDLEWVRERAPEAMVELLPSTLLLERYDAVAKGVRDSGAPRICFVGGLEWAPNEVGLAWFVKEVLPLVLERNPAIRVAVLARGAAERTWLRDHPAVDILPAESGAMELFASSDVSIAPLLQGGGVRIKIPESLALGCPVVATPVGAEGHALPGLTTTADPVEFAEACARLASEPSTETKRRQLRDAVEQVHDAHLLAHRLSDWWTALANDR